MRRVILRIFALGTVVVLGLFAIAHAQRSAPDPVADATADNPLRSPAADPPLRQTPVDPFALRAAAPDTPIRTTAPDNPIRSTPPANPIRIGIRDNPLRTAAPDNPIRTTGGDEPVGVNPVRAAGGSLPMFPDHARLLMAEKSGPPPAVSTDPPGSGPALSAGPTAGPPVGPAEVCDRRGIASKDDRSSGTALEIRDASPRSEPVSGQEPAPFKMDPAAIPAALSSTSPATGPAETALRTEEPILGSAADRAEGSGQPGDKQLEGPQSPQLTIQKVAPPQIQVGKPATFRVTVRNTGQSPAGNVEIRDQVPRGTRLLGTTPQASRNPRGELIWSLGTLKPGAESSVEMQLMPTAEGEIGSVATVHFDADTTARSVSTRPKLAIETSGNHRVLVGDEATLVFTVSNPGSGVATNVILDEHIPAGLQHAAGSQLEYTVGDLKPGESRKLELKLKATRAGALANLVAARGDAALRAEHRFDLEVVAPALDIAMAGPKRRYLEREATYQLSVANPGTAPAQKVELVAYLPAGMRFVGANNAGYYDEATRAVYWRLDELPVNEKGTVELVTLPTEAGQHSIKLRGSAQRGLTVEKEQPVLVEGIAAVLFQVSDTKDPIEVGGETAYEIRVLNQGSKAAGNVRVSVALPPEMKALAAEGPTRHVIDGGQVTFDGLAQLAPKAEITYRVRAQGLRPGDLRVRCQLLTDEMQTPVTKEESTRVYADE